MKYIYSSKLYKTSKRKDKIKAALANPINTELVQQLRSYLDEDELKTISEPEVEEPEEEISEIDFNDFTEDENKDSSSRDISFDSKSSSVPKRPRPSNSSSDDSEDSSLSDKFEDIENKLSDDADVSEKETETEDTEKESANSSQYFKVNKKPTKAEFQNVVGTTIQSLNDNESTKGVRNYSIRGNNELWVCYEDKVNLNNVMEDAIRVVCNACTNVEFNRLARTDNSIVFEIHN